MPKVTPICLKFLSVIPRILKKLNVFTWFFSTSGFKDISIIRFFLFLRVWPFVPQFFLKIFEFIARCTLKLQLLKFLIYISITFLRNITKSVFVCLTMHQKSARPFWPKTAFWDINEPKMGCIDDKLILFSATDSRRTWLSCLKFTEIQYEYLSKIKLARNSQKQT